MDDTQSVFGGQAFAQTNRKNQRPTARANETPGVFGAVKWLGWIAAEHPGLSERARIVVLLLVELSARNEAAFPSLRWLSEHLGCSPGSVRAAIREAEQAGLVQRAERFDQRAFSGGRQTSNSYAIAVPRAFEEEVAQARRGAQDGEASVALPRPTLASVRPHRGPLRDPTGAPCKIQQGVKELRVNLEEKANSTRGRESVTERQNAAAFLDQILPPERARSLKLRFGVQAFGSLLFALRRKTSVDHPALAASALGRVEAAQHVTNPGGYFLRILSDELAAAELVGGEPQTASPESAPDAIAALVKRIRTLNDVVGSVGNSRRREALYRQLNAAQDELRGLLERRSRVGAGEQAPTVAASSVAEPSLPAAEPLSHAELSQELELLREQKDELMERHERVCGFDGEAAERLRAELVRVKARGREVLALLEQLPTEVSAPAEREGYAEPSFTIEVGESGQETDDGDGALVTEEEMLGVRAELLVVGAQLEPPTVLSTLSKVAERDPSLGVALEKLGGVAVFRRPPEVAFRPLSQEELELSRRMQRAALLALREREDSGAVSVAVPVEERGDEVQRPGLAKVDPFSIGMGGITSAVAPAA